jgi:hypothetical protein
LPEELLTKSLESFRRLLGEKTPLQILQLHFDHYERRRLEKLRIVKEDRDLLVSEESHATTSQPLQAQIREKDAFIIEHQRRLIEKFQSRQEREIAQMIAQGAQMTGIQQRQMEVDAQLKVKEADRLEQVRVAAEEREARRVAEGEAKRREAALNEERRKELFQKYFEQEQRKLEDDRRNDKLRKREAQLHDEEGRRKAEEFKRRTELILENQRRAVEQRRLEMEAVECERLRVQEQVRLEKLAQSEAVRRLHEERVATAKRNLEKLLTAQKANFKRKQELSEKRRHDFEIRRLLEQTQAQQDALEKQKEIERTLQANKEIEAKRKLDFLETMRRADERKQAIERQAKTDRTKKQEAERQRDLMREGVLNRMKELVANRAQSVAEKLAKTDLKVEEVRAKQAWELRLQQEVKKLKWKASQEEVARHQRMQQYKRAQTLERIEEDNAVTQRVLTERNKLIQARFELRKELGRKKEELAKYFASSLRQLGRSGSVTKSLTSSLRSESTYQRRRSSTSRRSLLSESVQTPTTSAVKYEAYQLRRSSTSRTSLSKTVRSPTPAKHETYRRGRSPRSLLSVLVQSPTSSLAKNEAHRLRRSSTSQQSLSKSLRTPTISPAKHQTNRRRRSPTRLLSESVLTPTRSIPKNDTYRLRPTSKPSLSTAVQQTPTTSPVEHETYRRTPTSLLSETPVTPTTSSVKYETPSDLLDTKVKELRQNYKNEMQTLLKHEALKEKERTSTLQRVSGLERRKLEGVFELERANASHKLREFIERSEGEEARLIAKYANN